MTPRKPTAAFWIVVAVVLLPVVYVVSSGPLMKVAFRQKVVTLRTGTFTHTSRNVADPHAARLYRKYYGPLLSASERWWGTPLTWYWSLFRVYEV